MDEGECIQLQDVCAVAQAEYEATLQRYQDLSAEGAGFVAWRERLEEATEDLEACQEVMAEAQQLAADLAALLAQARADLATTTAERDALLAEDDTIRGQLDHLDEAREELQEEIAELEASIDPDNESLPELEEARETLQEVEALYGELIDRLDEIAGPLMDAIQGVEDLQARIEELEGQLATEQGVAAVGCSDHQRELQDVTAAYQDLDEAWQLGGDKHNEWMTMQIELEAVRDAWIEAAVELQNHCGREFGDLYPTANDLPDEFFEAEPPSE
jgi:chromosome segregation ATPase